MDTDRYKFEKLSEVITYRFNSEGPNGIITKLVEFDLMEEYSSPLYNLGFGDWEKETGRIDDRVVSNNRDMEKIFMSLAYIVMDFVKKRPEASIHLKGSTSSRTRLYQMWIGRFLHQINERFIILGYVKKHSELFKKGTNYHGFIVRQK